MNLINWRQQTGKHSMLKLTPESVESKGMFNITTIDREILTAQISHFINKHARFTDVKLRPLMADSLCNFIIDWVAKFDAGQCEHKGTDILSIDEDKELRAEYLDS